MLSLFCAAAAFTAPLTVRHNSAVTVTMDGSWRRSYNGRVGGAVATPSAAPTGTMSVEQCCTFMGMNPAESIAAKAAYLSSKGVSEFIITQATCCSALDQFGPVKG